MRLYTVPFSYKDAEKNVCLLPNMVKRNEAKDCVINTVYFLKMFKKEDAEMYAKIIHDQKIDGLKSQQIIDLIFTNFTQLSKTQDAVIEYKELSWTEVKKEMKPGTSTFSAFLNPNGKGGHAVVLFQDNQGTLGISDGHQQQLFIKKELDEWLKGYNTEKIGLLYESDKRIRKSDRKDEKQPAKRIRILSKSKSVKVSQKSLAKTPLAKETTTTTLKTQSKSVKKNPVKKGLKQNDLDKKRLLRITRKVKNDKKKRENLLKMARQPKMDVVEE